MLVRRCISELANLCWRGKMGTGTNRKNTKAVEPAISEAVLKDFFNFFRRSK
jgi:hypothetical protein